MGFAPLKPIKDFLCFLSVCPLLVIILFFCVVELKESYG